MTVQKGKSVNIQSQTPDHRRPLTLNHTVHTPEKRCFKERKPEQSQDDLTLVDELWGRVRIYPLVSTRAVHTEFQIFLREM